MSFDGSVSAVLLVVSLSVVAAVAQAFEPILVVIGDVGEHSARVMYDALDRGLVGSAVIATLIEDGVNVRDARLTLGVAPRIWSLTDLDPGRAYHVQFETSTGTRSAGNFSTLSEHSVKILVASCNNIYADGDESFFKQILDEDNCKNRTGMIHLGDQIYADFIFDEWDANGRRGTYDEILNQFRDTYRSIWSRPPVRALLSTAANWMLFDDHDILNNLDPDMLAAGLEVYLAAGRRALLEFQTQLQQDIFDDDGNECDQVHAYFTKRIGPLAFIFIDTRLERTFNFEPSSPFLGQQQLSFLTSSLEHFSADSTISKILIATSVPLLITPAKWVARLADLTEKEKMATHMLHQGETLAVLEAVVRYPDKVVLLSGDVHLFLHSQLCRRGCDTCLEQITTSGLTVQSTTANQLKILLFHFAALFLGSHLLGDWTVVHRQVNVGHNLVIVIGDNSLFSWTPIFHLSPSIWTSTAQRAFEAGLNLNLWMMLTTAATIIIAIAFFKVKWHKTSPLQRIFNKL